MQVRGGFRRRRAGLHHRRETLPDPRHAAGLQRIRAGLRRAADGTLEVGAEIARAEINHDDAGALHLIHEALVEGGEPGLGRVVDRLVGHAELAGDGGDVDQRAVLPREHAAQGGVAEARGVDEHHAQLLLPDGKVGVGERTEGAEAGVVDHDVETAGRLVRRQEGTFRGRAVAKLEGHGMEFRVGQLQPRGIARRAPDLDAGRQQHLGEGQSEARARARDERGAVTGGKRGAHA